MRFGSCFKHKVTDNEQYNETNLMSLSYLMMQRLLPYGLQNYLPDKIAKPIIELCSLFKQICSATLMEYDMLKAQIKVVDILYELELIYHPALFDIMVHLVIYLPIEALEGGPIPPPVDVIHLKDNEELKDSKKKSRLIGSQIRQRHVDNDQDPKVSTTNELFALANGTSWTPISMSITVVTHRKISFDVLTKTMIILMNEDAFLHDLADSDVEDLINVDDDGLRKFILMSSADVARSHGGDGGGDDRPPSHVVPTGCGGCFANKGKGKRKPNLGGRGAGRLNTRDKTRNLSLKDIAEAKGPVSISFDVGDKQTLNPLGPHAAHWSNYIGEVVRSVPLYYPSWEKVPKERKAAIISDIGTLFDLRPHMDSSRWTEIYEGINMHLQKAYNTNKASFKAKHWKADPTTGTYDVEAIRRARPEEITAAEWDKYIKFWNDPKNLARAAQNRLNRQKSVVTSRQGSRSLARLRDEMRQASDTQEYPSLIDTFWRTHTVDGVFPKDEDRRIYEEMKRLEATGEYTEDEINALARGGKLRGHIPGVGRVLPSRATSRPSMPAPDKSLKSMHRKVDFMMSLFRSDSKYSDMFKEFESGGASGSGGCGDDEESGDDEDGEDEDDDGER
ncbi:F-box domain containing protein [Tanacetum coccineum]